MADLESNPKDIVEEEEVEEEKDKICKCKFNTAKVNLLFVLSIIRINNGQMMLQVTHHDEV